MALGVRAVSTSTGPAIRDAKKAYWCETPRQRGLTLLGELGPGVESACGPIKWGEFILSVYGEWAQNATALMEM
jgi:hypothetical protein